MRTISVPTSKLIKFIPSEPDGGVIPGKVVSASDPLLVRDNDYTFRLLYSAQSPKASYCCSCKLDEELDVVSGSNGLGDSYRGESPVLEDDGVYFLIGHGTTTPHWDGIYCLIPDPFDALGTHQLSSFVKCGMAQIASLVFNDCPMLAVIAKDSNRTSGQLFGVNPQDSFQMGPPCQHNIGWLIPWQSKFKGINIAWLTDAEMGAFIDGSVELPKT